MKRRTQALRPFEARAAERELRSFGAALARVRGRLDAGRGDPASAEAAFTRAIETSAALEMPYETALGELELGELLRRRGHRRQGCGAAGVRARLLRRARRAPSARALRALAGEQRTATSATRRRRRRRPDRARAGGRGLVARGLKNREIAAELMLSIKTVEVHLTRVYAKPRHRGAAPNSQAVWAGADRPGREPRNPLRTAREPPDAHARARASSVFTPGRSCSFMGASAVEAHEGGEQDAVHSSAPRRRSSRAAHDAPEAAALPPRAAVLAAAGVAVLSVERLGRAGSRRRLLPRRAEGAAGPDGADVRRPAARGAPRLPLVLAQTGGRRRDDRPLDRRDGRGGRRPRGDRLDQSRRHARRGMGRRRVGRLVQARVAGEQGQRRQARLLHRPDVAERRAGGDVDRRSGGRQAARLRSRVRQGGEAAPTSLPAPVQAIPNRTASRRRRD